MLSCRRAPDAHTTVQHEHTPEVLVVCDAAPHMHLRRLADPIAGDRGWSVWQRPDVIPLGHVSSTLKFAVYYATWKTDNIAS